MRTDHGFSHNQERKSEFCITVSVAVGPVTRTADILMDVIVYANILLP